jgi:tripartite-type tricarboxylate transporter receptor subunit TctC
MQRASPNRIATHVAAGLLITFATATTARAEPHAYPAKPVTIVVPWPPGSAPDGIARILAPKLTDRLGKPFVIENRPGAGSVTGTASVAKAEADGHTILVATSAALAVSPVLRKGLPYDTMTDFAPLAMVGHVPFILVVNPSLPAHSVQDLMRLAKAKPGTLSYGSGGPGHPAHIYAELLKNRTGIEMVHVPYKGTPPALNDVVAGHIPLMFADVVPTLQLIAEGKVRALAVSSGTRIAVAPQIPPLAEAGVPGFDAAGWIMLVAAAKAPAEILSKLRSTLGQMLAEADVQSWINSNGLIQSPMRSADELPQFLALEIARWRRDLERIGLAGSQ